MGDCLIVIPARASSLRFPEKALAPIAGVPLIRRVALQVLWSTASRLVVATDDVRIARLVEDLCEVHLSAQAFATGTDRVAQAFDAVGRGEQFVINVQGDEPCLPPEILPRVEEAIASRGGCVSVCVPMFEEDRRQDPNVVEAVMRGDEASDFVREPHDAQLPWYQHVGIYAFDLPTLARFASRPVSDGERLHRLEQLRLTDAGERLGMVVATAWTNRPWPSINSPQDTARAEAYLAGLAPRAQSSAV
ncbi:MAG: hypothetical protein AUK47_14275 [Deltaproteobacteria bacterium CG2_30_63_29]|nr:MAG: hypothetical protein AUK47_14275 [Deltaproteobacteria bacterium CG2_30_63_29]PIW01646.1 MAG: hypothetical protein COW42_04265 [Deltaproteobacteria bacterium CG17_big_fil_post_rev_8_21_14_2_50_63_7]PJB44308.1 MAG: hypothetical protein CO108_08890 [Deltaproteobacteria bacterium CG_4_9_14_3_um_filter_63_12]